MPSQVLVPGLTSTIATGIANNAAKLQMLAQTASRLVVATSTNIGDDAFHNVNAVNDAMKLFPGGAPASQNDTGALGDVVTALKALGVQPEVQAQYIAGTIDQLKRDRLTAQVQANALQSQVDALKAQLALAQNSGGGNTGGTTAPPTTDGGGTPPVVALPGGTTTPPVDTSNSSTVGWAIAAAAAAGLVAYLATRQADASHHLQGK